ncbi:MAG: DUF2155 domain-containing protein [Alphaproteobacteria bacterium]|jgi:hypothetical protein|nr:DUF2155 domain-containing protein [Alphaproteobacteria bacterium]
MIKKYLLICLFCLFATSIWADDYTKSSQAQVRLLNKYTGKTEKATLRVGQNYVFDKNLNILLRVCYKSSAQDEPESKAFIQVIRVVATNLKEDVPTLDIPIPNDFRVKVADSDTTKFIFSGWLFASSPSVSYLEDPIYDITLLRCY